MFRGRVEEYWLPTPFACFPFTSPPVRHRVPSDCNWTLPLLKLYRTRSIRGKKFSTMPLHFLQISLRIIRIVDEAKGGEAGTNYGARRSIRGPGALIRCKCFDSKPVCPLSGAPTIVGLSMYLHVIICGTIYKVMTFTQLVNLTDVYFNLFMCNT